MLIPTLLGKKKKGGGEGISPTLEEAGENERLKQNEKKKT